MVTSTTSPTATSSLVTALGGGSGIDMLDLANKLAQAQFAARNQRLTDRADKLGTQISSISNIKSMLLGLDTSLGTLVRSGSLARTPLVANASVATAALSGTQTPKGTYSLEVTQLAANQTLASKPFTASNTAVGAGTLTLRFGTVSGASFAADTSRAAADITIASGATLADVANAINTANTGVTAYVAQTVDGAQLVMKGAEGAANGFQLEVTEDAGEPGLSDLAWTPASTTGQLLSTGRDAAFKIDGLEMTAQTNAVSEAIPGVKLQLTGTNVGAPTKVSFADPTTSIASAMQDLTDALNEVMAEVNADTSIGGDLANDAGARALKRSLAQLAGTVIMPNSTGAARTLADLGLKTERDGTFSLDTARLNATIASDPQGVADMFTNGLYGVYATVDGIYRAASSSSNSSSLGGSLTRYTKQLTQNTADQSTLAEQQEKLRARLASQFTVSETRIGQSKATLTMLQNQIAQWNKSGN